MKASETEQGQRVEAEAVAWLAAEGYAAERQTTKAPFDLLVGLHRIDVKSAHYSEHVGPLGAKTGWVFHLHKVPPTCDFYLLVCLDDSEQHMRRYLIPAQEAQVQTITITARGKYERFRDALELLES